MNEDELREEWGDPVFYDSLEYYTMTQDEEQKELIKSIKNRCDIFLLICDLPNTEHLWATLCEDIHADSQDIIDNFCIVY